MEFSLNHPILFVFVGLIIAAVVGQSVYFLVKSYRRAKEIGMDMTKVHKTIKTAAIFTIAPAISIVITVVTLSQSLGVALPWLRLSVVGSLSYETIAATNAASGMGKALTELANMNASEYVTVVLVAFVVVFILQARLIQNKTHHEEYNLFSREAGSLFFLVQGIRSSMKCRL